MDKLLSVIPGVVWPAVPDAGGASILAALFQLERSQWWSPAKLWEHQRTQLKSLLRHAVETSPHIARTRGEQIARLTEDFMPEHYSRLPILTRAEVQRHHDDMVSRSVPRQHGNIHLEGTSGSTGEPVRFLNTDLVNFFWQAFNLRDHLWHNRDFSLKLATIRYGKSAESMHNWFGEVGESTVQTGPCVMISPALSVREQAVRVIEEDPAYLTGYVNNLVGVLREIDSMDGKLPELRQVRSFGEAVTDASRRYVTERWSVPLIDLYSTRESGYVALQCPDGTGYHVQSEGIYVEIVDANGKACGPGETGRVVVTPLHNFSYPLVRYELGDYAQVGAPCRCGRGLPAIDRIFGRSRNLMKLRDGSRRWPMLGTPGFRDIAPVRQYQVVQLDFDELEVRMAVERPLTPDEQRRLGEVLLANLGHPFRLHWVFLPRIPENGGGKFEDFVSFDG